MTDGLAPLNICVSGAFQAGKTSFIRALAPVSEVSLDLAQAYGDGALSERKRRSVIKGRIPVWVACFQAMRGWPSIEPGDLQCPALLLAGTKNRSAMAWLKENDEPLARAGVQVEIIAGLTHQQEFSQIDRVYPAVTAFFGHTAELV